MMATGGRYVVAADGTMTRVEEPTAHHEGGAAPREADGRMIGADGLPVDPPPATPELPAPPAPPEGEEV